MKHAPPNWIYVDVDGTLCHAVIEWCRRQKTERGTRLVLWSSRGQEHARRQAERFGCVDLFEAILSKPGRIVDDMGWGWVRYTRAILPGEVSR